jgi:hypothetical protein
MNPTRSQAGNAVRAGYSRNLNPGACRSCRHRYRLTAIAADDLLHEIDDPMAHCRTRYPHERFD